MKDNSVARIKPYVPYGQQRQEDDDRSIYVEGLSTKYKDEAKIVDFFEKHVGPVTCTRIPKNKANKINFCGFCFVEFETSQLVEKAINVFKNNDKFNIRVMSK
jgi:RNA recognition motif-containing protein